MAKILIGKVVSTAMTNVIVVEVTTKTPHPKYKKLLKRSKKFKVAVNGQTVAVGDTVSMKETRPLSKDMHFALYEPEKKAKAVNPASKAVVEEPVKTETPKKSTPTKAKKKEGKE